MIQIGSRSNYLILMMLGILGGGIPPTDGTPRRNIMTEATATRRVFALNTSRALLSLIHI